MIQTNHADPARWRALGVVLLATFMVLLDTSIVNNAVPAIQADLAATPAQIQLVLVTSLLSAQVARRLGTRVLILGGLLLCAGVGGVLLTLALRGAALTGLALLPALLIGGAGFGLIIGPLTTLILAGVQPDLAASASGVLGTAQQVGGALGIAVVGALLFGRVAGQASVAGLSRTALFSQATQTALYFNLAAFVVALLLFALLPAAWPSPTTGQAAGAAAGH